MKFRRQWDDQEQARLRRLTAVTTGCDTPVQQSARDDADLNVLVKRFGLEKAPIPPAVYDPAYYGEVDDLLDLRTAIDRVRLAEARFMALPVQLRRRFDNDASRLWSWVNDPANAEEAVKLGLLAASPMPVPGGARGQGATIAAPASPDSPPASPTPVAAS